MIDQPERDRMRANALLVRDDVSPRFTARAAQAGCDVLTLLDVLEATEAGQAMAMIERCSRP